MESKSLSTTHRYQSIFSRNEGQGERFAITSANPKFWGPPYWKTFFSTAAAYPISDPTKEQKEKAVRFFHSFGDALPCEKCRVSYRELLQRFPITESLQNRKALLTWVWVVRDQVNRKLICQEREELKKQLDVLPTNSPAHFVQKLKDQILYTKESPSLETILKKWFFIHEE